MKKKIVITLIFSLLNIVSFAQNIPVGAWRTHLTYRNAQSLAVAEDKIYVASKNACFWYNKSTQQTKIMGKDEGLSDIGFSKIAYSPAQKTLILTYNNGNIDLLKENENVNIKTIFNSRFDSKKINHIFIQENIAYLSTDFGVVLLDVVRNLILESYTQIGTNGNNIPAYALTIANNQLFVATSEGVKFVPLSNSINKQDFRNWKNISLPPNSVIKTIATLGNDVFFGIEKSSIFKYSNGVLTAISGTSSPIFYDLSAQNNRIFASTNKQIFQFGNDLNIEIIADQNIDKPLQIALDKDSKLWIADENLGLVGKPETDFKVYTPKGVFASDVFKIKYLDKKIIALAGGYNEREQAQNNLNGFYWFENDIWTNYNSFTQIAGSTTIPPYKDLVSVAFDTQNQQIFFASLTDGLVVWDLASQKFSNFTNVNSPLENSKVSGVLLDSDQNLIVSNYGVNDNKPVIFQRKNNGSWGSLYLNRSFAFQNDDIDTSSPVEMILDDAKNIWVRQSSLQSKGILVFNVKGESKKINNYTTNGTLTNDDVLCFAKDLQGNIWAGTEKGIFYFSPISLTSSGNIVANIVRYNDRFFLRDERVTAVAIDGANRKWIGTDNGVWLYDENTSEKVVANFTAQNSPLISNKIKDIAVHAVTGEVFFATDQGIVSYRGSATEATSRFEEVKIFPNPVPPAFNGVLSISGLVENANVKITDVSGKMVFQGNSQGGTFTWNLADYNGVKARTGVYIIFCANNDGSETFVGKVAVVE
ncbi:MAG: T9SS C-terminal target domain-containing protein [Bacteroidetes bacterium]|nr:MAG: T9SS C-terminal target domain-containing protein [Bacteroidota bacterium]